MISFLPSFHALLSRCLVVLAAGLLAWPAPSRGGGTFTVNVDGRNVTVEPNGEILLPSPQSTLTLRYVANLPVRKPERLRYKLEGFDDRWRDGKGEMFLAVRFLDAAGDQVSQVSFGSVGESPAWTGDLTRPVFTRRRENVPVPPRAASFWIVISSAGPPATLGLYAVKNLQVSRINADGGSEAVPLGAMQFPAGAPAAQAPKGWIRDGSRRTMAKLLDLENARGELVFAVEDDDPTAHGEWHMTRETASQLAGADHLAVQWSELYTIGVADLFQTSYQHLRPGEYTFRVERSDILGVPMAELIRLRVRVRAPFWQSSWFWAAMSAGLVLAAFGGLRYAEWRRMHREIARFKQEQALDRERLRIAQDIHDDLGARATHILLLSGMGSQHAADAARARGTFAQITGLTQDLVFALYQTVWTVNPENDHLPSLADHLCQIASRLCAAADLRCRLQADRFAPLLVSSEVRHHVSMAVSEAIHNAVKHAQAGEITLMMRTRDAMLEIAVQDDGRGLDADGVETGHGLGNMRTRMAQIGGEMNITSTASRGTAIRFRLPLTRLSGAEPSDSSARQGSR